MSKETRNEGDVVVERASFTYEEGVNMVNGALFGLYMVALKAQSPNVARAILEAARANLELGLSTHPSSQFASDWQSSLDVICANRGYLEGAEGTPRSVKN